MRKLSTLKGQPANLKVGNIGSFRVQDEKIPHKRRFKDVVVLHRFADKRKKRLGKGNRKKSKTG